MSTKRLGGIGLFVLCIAALAAAQETRPGQRTLFSAALADVPGKQLVVVELDLPPRQEGRVRPPGHRHGAPLVTAAE